MEQKGRQTRLEHVLLGITKAAYETESFTSAAQETTPPRSQHVWSPNHGLQPQTLVLTATIGGQDR
jgi:hypothetical protein